MDDGGRRGLLDTSVVIDLPEVPVERLPDLADFSGPASILTVVGI